jgi:hypothetical protein
LKYLDNLTKLPYNTTLSRMTSTSAPTPVMYR